ncbi:PH domain-containing protein [Nocardioides aestuarii]|uniref:PH domain-containing protein n=1 Tax=Nocardioides aestuarii TaxID=252231 RepID=A0ABW4TNA0_9ACTN
MTEIPAPPPPLPETPWLRLDPRMLLVHPVREVGRFLPVLIGVVVLGAGGNRLGWPQLLAVVVPVGIGLARYLTTRYRIHADRVELRRGLVSTHILSTSLDRVRTVDITASPIQRVLSLATVRIGTGTGGDDDLDLDGLPTEQARALRAQLLHSIRPPAPATDDPDGEPAVVGGEEVVARFEPAWVRYAPFTSAGFVAMAAVVGVVFQLGDDLGFLDRFEDDPAAVSLRAGSAVAVAVLGVAVLGVVVAFSVIGYLVANGNFALSHTTPDGSWHVRRGLLTTRETSLDDERLRGVAVGEPLGLRLVRGGRLSAIVTGLDRSESGSSALLPPTPRRLVDRVAAAVVGSEEPVHATLVDHGPRARTRRWTRALVPAALMAVALVVLALLTDLGGLAVLAVLPLVVGAVLGWDRARSLGHALVGDWLVARSGSLTRRRELLATDAVIGWNLHSTWFQRRAGLVTLVATTAGGSQRVVVVDVPEEVAVRLTTEAVPGLAEQFRSS